MDEMYDAIAELENEGETMECSDDDCELGGRCTAHREHHARVKQAIAEARRERTKHEHIAAE